MDNIAFYGVAILGIVIFPNNIFRATMFFVGLNLILFQLLGDLSIIKSWVIQ